MSSFRRLIPNLLTAGNLIGGILAIIFTLKGQISIAPYFILISAFLDFFDGFAARLLKVQGDLGKQLDSLADMVTFGVAPGLIMFEIMALSLKMRGLDNVMWLKYAALIIPIFAMFRLAKFNIDDRQSEGFIGLPTPAMSLFFISFPLLLGQTTAIPNFGPGILYAIGHPFVLFVLILTFSILMVIDLPLFGLKFKHFKWKGNEIRYVFLGFSLILIAVLYLWAIPLIIVLYILLSLGHNLSSK